MTRIPSKDAILDWIRDNPGATTKRDIARAFGIKGADRVALKAMLRELKDEGHLTRRHRRPGELPPVTILIAGPPDADGDIWARPKDWDADGPAPRILFVAKPGDPALGAGDRFLAKIHRVDGPEPRHEARLIKRIERLSRRLLGVFRAGAEGGRVVPVEKRNDKEWIIPPGAEEGAEDGELVEAESTGGPRMGLPRGRIVARLGDPGAPRMVSLIALHEYGIPDAFSAAALAEAEAAAPPQDLGEDLTAIPFVTIDPADARDHDDAVAAEPDRDPGNPGGHILHVAIADVAWFVRPGSSLDREARKRGNSTYFPDRVSPMLPERLSADLCSLIEGAERSVLALRITLDAAGQKIAHRFTRGRLRSRASLTYEQAQALADGRPAGGTEAFAEPVAHLFAAYRALARAREARQPLALDLPERRVELDRAGNVSAITIPERLDAHRLIEEFMVLSNVCAAETLEARRTPLLYRVHEEPAEDRIEGLREFVETLGLTLAKGQRITTRHLNALLAGSEGETAELVSLQVLRAQTQAYYARQNFGHFGLALARYAHFTSPIRRYADLVVHRALIAALRLGPGGLEGEEIDRLDETAKLISETERRSMQAERDTTDRYLARFLSEREGATFRGRIAGVTRAGLFVKLDETGADGIVPISSLGREYFRHDRDANTLRGEDTGTTYALGQRCEVRLVEAAPLTGGLRLELLSAEGAGGQPRKGRRPGPAPRRKLGQARIAAAKAKRKGRRG